MAKDFNYNTIFKNNNLREEMYHETEWYEMTPDVYAGENMDEHIPLWTGYVSGDKDSETFSEPIVFDPKDYPPGTKIIVKEPVCPKCLLSYIDCMSRPGFENDCDFDWKELAEILYS